MNNEFILIIVGLIAIALMTQKRFWILVLGLCTLASGFTVLASIINFQIIVAVGFTVLTVVLASISGKVIE
jgi:membrane protein implicated in regulation of membrane protease activity